MNPFGPPPPCARCKRTPDVGAEYVAWGHRLCAACFVVWTEESPPAPNEGTSAPVLQPWTDEWVKRGVSR